MPMMVMTLKQPWMLSRRDDDVAGEPIADVGADLKTASALLDSKHLDRFMYGGVCRPRVVAQVVDELSVP
jgi:hypothetical protein